MILVGRSPELGWIPHFFHIKKGSSYFWSIKIEFQTARIPLFHQFWPLNEIHGERELPVTPKGMILFPKTPSSPFFSPPFFWQERTQTSPCFFYFHFWVAGHVKKEIKESQTRKQFQFPILPTSKKKGVSILCVSPNVPSAALPSFLRSLRPWMTCTCSSRPIRRPPRARQNDGVNWGWRCRGENVPWYGQGFKGMGVPRPQCNPWYLYSWCWFLGGL